MLAVLAQNERQHIATGVNPWERYHTTNKPWKGDTYILWFVTEYPISNIQ